MKITYTQLEANLNRSSPLSPLYVVSGDEPLLKQDAAALIETAAKRAGFFDKIRLSATDIHEESLYALLSTTAFLASSRFIHIDFHDATPNKASAKILEEYSQHPVATDVVLISIGKCDQKTMKTSWYQTFEKKFPCATLWPIAREQLPQWIIQRARKFELRLSLEVAKIIADYTEGNLLATSQTIEKLYLLSPSKIDAETLREIFSDDARFSLFDFIEHLVAGVRPRALHALKTLENEGTEPVLILWGITRELRLLAEYARQIANGLSFDALFQKNRIFARRQIGVRKFLKKYTENDCLALLAHLAEIDRMIKGANTADPWQSLELFCLRM